MANHLPLLARFNGWANRRLYAACASLDDTDYRRDRKAFFGSIHNTLNHILVVDRLYLGRIEGTPHGIERLDQILYDDLAALRSARIVEDERIVALVDGCDESRLGETVDYRYVDGGPATGRVDLLLVNLFNHQTHHRGQVHTMLSQAGVEAPALDLLDYLDDAMEAKRPHAAD